MIKLSQSNIHKDWYFDEIESSRKLKKVEALWRLDVDEHIQVQLFLTPMHWDFKKYDFNGPDDEWHEPRIFIERDSRENLEGGDQKRVYYACSAWPLTESQALELLTASKDEAVQRLRDNIACVMGLPCDQKMCDAYNIRETPKPVQIQKPVFESVATAIVWKDNPDGGQVAQLGLPDDGVTFYLTYHPTCHRRGPHRLFIDVCGGVNHHKWGCFDADDQPTRHYHLRLHAHLEAIAIAKVLLAERLEKGPIGES